MAKKNEKQLQPPAPPAQESPAMPAPAPAAGSRPVTNGQIALFWGVVVLTVATAWVLARLLPGTPERLIERWLMLPFGLFLVVFLFRLK
ncbi:MAG TPA: hypothetical protein PKI19_08935 [Elusimicrobiales bacterium]|nr:hypothetical protein [Elusimicrobiales bacterium]